MFEIEAEEYIKEHSYFDEEFGLISLDVTSKTAFQDGAEFGYKEGIKTLDDMTRAFNREHKKYTDLRIANEWHYVKDVNCYEDLHFPPEEEEKGRVLIWKVQVITENGVRLPVCYHCGSYGDLWYEINAYHVIAWKEIVLPELKESR